LRGTIEPPGDKSISHRAAILNAIAQGEATVDNFQTGADCLATVRCLRTLGVRIEASATGTLRVQGAGRSGLREASAILNAANSGTTLRLLAGLLAAQPFFSVLSGDASLRSRPMGRIVEPVRAMGGAHPRARRRYPPTSGNRGRPPAGRPSPAAGRQRTGEIGPDLGRPLC
jgi:3-phosphoshikimate 1-carboxyvinyltransferase